MFLTKDYLKLDPWEAIINVINNAYNVELYPNTTELVELIALGETHTQFKIKVNRSESEANIAPVLPTDTFTINRLNLSTFFKGVQVLDVYNTRLPMGSLEFIEHLGKVNGINFVLDDFEHFVLEEFNTIYTLKANPDSLRFTGQIQFRIINNIRQDIDSVGPTKELPTANRWPDNNDGTKINGSYYITGYDFTEYRDYLLTTGKAEPYPDAKKLAAILTNVTGINFLAKETKASHNIVSEKAAGVLKYDVVYLGKPLPRFSPRTDIDNVLVIKLNPNLCDDVVGQLLIHFN